MADEPFGWRAKHPEWEKEFQQKDLERGHTGSLYEGAKKELAGAGEAALTTLTGTAGFMAGSAVGGAVALPDLLGGPTAPGERKGKWATRGAKVKESIEGALTYEPRTKEGKRDVGIVSAPFEAWNKWVTTPLMKAMSKATDDPMLVGMGGLADLGPAEIARRGKAKVEEKKKAAQISYDINKPRMETLKAGQKEGLAVSPSEAKTGTFKGGVASTMESLSGEPKASKIITWHNAPEFDRLAKRDVGLPEDRAIDIKDIRDKRTQVGDATYEPVKRSGSVELDQTYESDIKNLMSGYDQAAKDFPHVKEDPAAQVLESFNPAPTTSKQVTGVFGLKSNIPTPLTRKKVDASSIVEVIKIQGRKADEAYAAGNRGLGMVHRGIKSALEDLLERHLQSTGQHGLYDAYLSGRTQIAKLNLAEDAWDAGQGHFNPQVYADYYEKVKGDKSKMTGDSRLIGEFASRFKKSSRPTSGLGATGPTIFDAGLGLGGGIGALLMGHGGGGALEAAALAAGARTGVRFGQATGPYQRAMLRPKKAPYGLGLKAQGWVNDPLAAAIEQPVQTDIAERNK